MQNHPRKNHFSMIIAMIPQKSMADNNGIETQTEFTNTVAELQGAELLENTEEKEYSVLTDVIVVSELLNDNIVKITLTNVGEFVISEWTMVYEASYDIVTIENAELVMNSEVKELTAIDENETLEVGMSTVITMMIDGSYENNVNYRVYGIGEGVLNPVAITDFITYDSITGETSLTTFDLEEIQVDNMGSAYTQGTTIVRETGITELLNAGNVVSVDMPPGIVGNDDRLPVSDVNVSPYCRIACLIIELEDGHTVSGTGFMIGARHMLTAAHCVWSRDTFSEVESITAYFGTGMTNDRVTSWTPVDVSSWSYCAAYPSSQMPQNDWACLRLSSQPGRGKFSIGYMSKENLMNIQLTICGYPRQEENENVPATINGETWIMCKMSGYPVSNIFMDTQHANTIDFKIDATAGQSGSPVYNNSNIVYGIYSSAYGAEGNAAYRLTAENVNMFVEMEWCS